MEQTSYNMWVWGFLTPSLLRSGNILWQFLVFKQLRPKHLVSIWSLGLGENARLGGSVSNKSGLSLRVRVRVRVQTELLPNTRSGLSINPHCQLGYSLMVNSHPVWIGRVGSRLPSGSIHRFIYHSCFWSMLIVSYQNRVFNNQWEGFACFAAYNIG